MIKTCAKIIALSIMRRYTESMILFIRMVERYMGEEIKRRLMEKTQ